MPRPRTPAEATAAALASTVVPGSIDPATSFIIDPRKEGRTPKDIDRQRAMAAQLAQQGSDTSPATMWQAAMRPVVAAEGALTDMLAGRSARDAQAEQAERWRSALQGDMTTPEGKARAYEAAGSPWATDFQQKTILQETTPQKPNIIDAGDGILYNADTGEWLTAPAGAAAGPKAAEYRGFTQQFSNLPGVKAFKEVLPKFNAVRELAKRGHATKAESLGLIYNIANILDPGSVVRKEDGDLIFTKAQSAANGMKSYVIGLMSGDSGLTDEIYNLYQLAEQQVGSLHQQATGERESQIKGTTGFGMTGEDYYLDPFDKLPPPQPPRPSKYGFVGGAN